MDLILPTSPIFPALDFARIFQRNLLFDVLYYIKMDDALKAEGKNPFQLDSKEPTLPLEKYIYNETRYKMLTLSKPEAAQKLLVEAQADVQERWRFYQGLANLLGGNGAGEGKTEAD